MFFQAELDMHLGYDKHSKENKETINRRNGSSSLTGAEAFVYYLNEFVNQNKLELDIAGILPVLLKGDSIYDNSSFNNAKELFGEENIFSNVVKNMERLKKYDAVGIIDPDIEPENSDFHDKKVHGLYKNVANELLTLISELEEG